ncbi:hypothetical protein RSAG8_11576, partial [Rhizoctonia solani AG-8 WAC10335]
MRVRSGGEKQSRFVERRSSDASPKGQVTGSDDWHKGVRPTPIHLGPCEASLSLRRLSPTSPSATSASETERNSILSDQVKLLNQFIKVQYVAYEYTDIPPNPHPAGEPYAAKTSAFLLASHFSSNPHHRSLATDLLECARECIDEAIRTADISSQSMALARPMPSPALVLDAIHASSLLASWLLVQNVESSSGERPIKAMIPRPVGIADTKNRVGIFWQLLCLDYTAAILMGSSVNVSLPWEDCPSEVRVETIWPDFDSNGTTCTSIASLFQTGRKASPAPTLGSTGSIRAGSPSSAMDPHALRAKSIVLLERAVRLSAQRERGSRASTPRSPHSPGQASPTRTTLG